MRMLSARISSLGMRHLKNGKTDAHAEHARKELMRMLRVHIIFWQVFSVFASVPDAYAKHARKEVNIFNKN